MADGLNVWIIESGLALTGGLADSLRRDGARVSLARDPDLSSTETAITALDALPGDPDVVLVSLLPEALAHAVPITEQAPETWTEGEEILFQAISLLRTLKPTLQSRKAPIIFLAPSLSLVGTRNMVALTTLLESLRGLMKSVARQWGAEGLRLNWIAVAPRALSPAFADAPLAAKPDAVSVAMGGPVDPADLAPLIAFLASEGGKKLAGATIPVDGGEFMVP